MSARGFTSLHDDHVRRVPRLPGARGAVARGSGLAATRMLEAGCAPRGTEGDRFPALAPAW